MMNSSRLPQTIAAMKTMTSPDVTAVGRETVATAATKSTAMTTKPGVTAPRNRFTRCDVMNMRARRRSRFIRANAKYITRKSAATNARIAPRPISKGRGYRSVRVPRDLSSGFLAQGDMPVAVVSSREIRPT